MLVDAPTPGRATAASSARPHHFPARALFVLSAIFIVYATTLPFQFVRPPSLDRATILPYWNRWDGELQSVPDMIQNIALFLPYGFFGWLAIDKVRAASAIRGALSMAALGLLLSLFVELLQTMSADRQPSTTDIANNTIGAAAGAGLAWLFVTRHKDGVTRRLSAILAEQPGMVVVAAAGLLVAFEMLAPFIPSLDIGLTRHKVRLFLDAPFGKKPIGSLPIDAAVFALLAFFAATELPSFLSRRRKLPATIGDHRAAATLASVGAVVSIAVVLEAAQIVLVHHQPGLLELTANTAGIVLGATAAVAVSRVLGRGGPAAALGDLTRRAPALALGFALLFPALRALAPFELRPIEAGLARTGAYSLLPFASLFANLRPETIANVAEAAASYLPLGWVLAALGKRSIVAFLVALALAESLEVLQIVIAGRTFDVTEGLTAATGAIAGAWCFQRLVSMTKQRLV